MRGVNVDHPARYNHNIAILTFQGDFSYPPEVSFSDDPLMKLSEKYQGEREKNGRSQLMKRKHQAGYYLELPVCGLF